VVTRKHAFIAVCTVLLAAGTGLAAVQDTNDFKTELDKISYILGRQIGDELKSQGIVNVNADMLARGVRDILAGRSGPLSQQQQQGIVMAWQQKRKEQAEAEQTKRQAEQAQRQAEQAKRDEEAIKRLNEQGKGWKLKLTMPPVTAFDPGMDYFWVLDTNKGQIRIKLTPQVAPMHVSSTIFLTRKGFYDGTTFHRVVTDFMAQGGDPIGTGRGGPGYAYGGEIKPNIKFDRPYLLGMANSGQPNTDGSQFFITFGPTPHLNGLHTLFGEVVAGQDTLKKLEAAGGPPPDGIPTERLIINKATIEEKPKG